VRRSRRPFIAFVPAFFVVLLAPCVPDYLGTPRIQAFSFQVLPETAWVAVGDTVPSPFRCALTVDGSPKWRGAPRAVRSRSLSRTASSGWTTAPKARTSKVGA